jgi:hypothetical protein
MQAGMPIPQELLKESVKKPKTDGVHAVGLKYAIKKKEFHVRYNPTTFQLRVFCNAKPVKKEIALDIWAKFTADGRRRMKASAYREWCETNDRNSLQPVKFNTKNGPILRVAEYYKVAKSVEWANLGPATEKNIKSHPQVW